MEAEIFEYHNEEDTLDTESFQGMFAFSKTDEYAIKRFGYPPIKSISLMLPLNDPS